MSTHIKLFTLMGLFLSLVMVSPVAQAVQMTATPTPNALKITAVQPFDGATEVDRYTKVTVYFNRPVVSLSAIEAAEKLPQPLTFEPAIDGTGQWIDTSTYEFTPESAGFRRGETYTARIAKGLADSFDEAKLTADFAWTFSIIAPTPTPRPSPTPTPVPLGITESSPKRGDTVGPKTTVSVTFSQPMYRQGVQAQFHLTKKGSAVDISGRFEWREEPERFTFTPDEPLDPETEYQVYFPKGLSAEVGTAVTAQNFKSSFKTAPLPQMLYTKHYELIDVGNKIVLRFNHAMNPDSLVLNKTIFITSAVPIEEGYINWPYSDNNKVDLNFPFAFSQLYTVVVTPGLLDIYGQSITQSYSMTYRTKPQAALLFIESPEPVAIYNGYVPTKVLITTRNVNQVRFILSRMRLTSFLALHRNNNWYDDDGWNKHNWRAYVPDIVDVVSQWTFTPTTELNQKKLTPVDVGAGSGLGPLLPPGIYYLRADVPRTALMNDEVQWTSDADAVEQQILVVSKYQLAYKESPKEKFTWLTDLATGQPVSGVPITFIENNNKQMNSYGIITTAVDGVAQLNLDQSHSLDNLNVVVAGNPDTFDSDFAITHNNWNQGIDPYSFYDNGVWVESEQSLYYGYFYTHRGLYRANETVYFKGILRRNQDATYQIPTALKEANVFITDPQGLEVFNQKIPLNEMGTVNGTLHLDKAAALGDYTLAAHYAGQQFYTTFQVQAYRLPEFQLEVYSDRARYAQGETISATVMAKYFFGGPVANAKLHWTIFSEDFSYNYGGLDAYDFRDEDYSMSSDQQNSWGYGRLVAEGDAVTDGQGYFNFQSLADNPYSNDTQLYTIDVQVTDLNNQQVAVQARVLVDKSRFLVGLKTARKVGQVGQAMPVSVLVVDWLKQPVSEQPVKVIISEYNRYSTQTYDPDMSDYSGVDSYYWRTFDQADPIITTTLMTDKEGQATLNFTPKKGGIYQITATSRDDEENLRQSSTFVWISGQEYVNWGQDESNNFKLVADKAAYQVGEVAKILVPHPYSQPVTALVTYERGHVHDHFVTELKNNSQQLEIPITEAMLPNMYISVMVVQGTQDAPNNAMPSFKITYINLSINPDQKALNIVLTPNKEANETYQPREQVTYNINVTDAQNQPVKTELSLALVDKAVLSLAPRTPGQLLKQFWSERGLGVNTASNLTKAIDDFNQRLLRLKGGDGCPDCGGLTEKGFGQTRRNFLDTALWVADFVTDEQGHGTVTADLPDNLTTWTLTGIGVTGASTLVGENTTDIVTTMPLIVRPMTPRFLVVGDEVQLGLIVQNNSNSPQEVAASFEAQGLAIRDWRLNNLAGEPISEWSVTEPPIFTVSAGQKFKVEYRVTVLTPTFTAAEQPTAVLTMTGVGEDYQDSLTFALPVYRASTPSTVATAGMLMEDGQVSEAVELPQSYDPTQGDLRVQVDGSLAAGMRAGLTYLEHYPYECTEQTVSRFLPNVVTSQAYQSLKVQNPDLAAKLPDLVSLGRQRLYQHQHSDGGWGWWVDDKSNPQLTAYVLQGLLEAKRAGFAIDETTLTRGLSYLTKQLLAPKNIDSTSLANRQAFMLYVLAEGGQGDVGRMTVLFDKRQLLGHFGRAYLAMGFQLMNKNAPQIATLVNDLTSAAKTSATGVHWEESARDYESMNTDTQSTAIIVAALSRLQPDHPMLPKAVRWLMVTRSHGGYWATTQETAWAIMGLTEWMIASGELAGNYEWQVSLNNQALGQGRVTTETITSTQTLRVAVADLLADAANRLTLSRRSLTPAPLPQGERSLTPAPLPVGEGEGGEGTLYYAAYLTYYQTATEIKAIERGISVSRNYRLKDSNDPVTMANVGEVIEVEVMVIAPSDLHYVMIEDPLPAGLEAINPALATSSVADQSDRYNSGNFDHVELRDEKVVLFATYLPKGTYRYYYLARATMPGRYQVIPTHAEQMYFPEIFGRGAGRMFEVK